VKSYLGCISAVFLACQFYLVLCGSASAQTDDPFSIQVESNTVIVRAEVFQKGSRSARATPYYDACMDANNAVFKTLSMPQPYLPKLDCLKDIEVDDLKLQDFHLLEDGAEQKLDSVRLERLPWGLDERDVVDKSVTFHTTWSFSPRSIWRGPDLEAGWKPAGAMYFYRLSYVPPKLEAGDCHKLKVTVDRAHSEVFATDQYCYVPHSVSDPLLGSALGSELEKDLTSDSRTKLAMSAQAGHFYPNSRNPQIDLVLEFPYDKLAHRWNDNDLDAKLWVVGAAFTRDGTVAARFSDFAFASGAKMWTGSWASPDSYDVAVLPSRYETQLDLPPGQYTLRVVLSDGEKFGRVVIPITVDPYPQAGLALSSLFVYQRSRITAAAAQERAAANLAPDYVPLVSQDIEITPTADPTFDPKELLPAYFEIYAPALAQPGVSVQARLRIVDASGAVKAKYAWFDATPYRRPERNVFAITKSLSLAQFPNGEYQIEAQAKDSAGHKTAWRSAKFTVKKRRLPKSMF
jgi:hypothetical protein